MTEIAVASTDRRRRVIFSIDYEVFGNGTGDVRQHVVDPTERMTRIAERYDLPLVIFFELEDTWLLNVTLENFVMR